MAGLTKRYMLYGVTILLVVWVATAVAGSLMPETSLLAANTISFVFQLLLVAAFGTAWEKVVKTSPKSLPVLYMSATGLRLLLAAAVLLVYMFANRGSESLLAFSAVFVLYYIIILIYDTVFFVSAEKKHLR